MINVNNNAVVIQRVNECDERKNTKNVNKQIIYANKFVDYTVFVSNWLQDLYLKSGINLDNSKVIKSGSDTRIFNQVNKRAWDKKEKFSSQFVFKNPNETERCGCGESFKI